MKFAKEEFGRLKEKIKERFANRKKMTPFSLIFYIGVVAVILVLIGGLVHQSLLTGALQLSAASKRPTMSR